LGDGILGGRFGANLNELLIHEVGSLGTALIYLFSFLAFLVIAFNSSLKISWLSSKKIAAESPEDTSFLTPEFTTEAATKVNVYSHRNDILREESNLSNEETHTDDDEDIGIPLDEVPEFEVKEITPESALEDKKNTNHAELDMEIAIPSAKDQATDNVEFTLHETSQQAENQTITTSVTANDLVKKYGEYDPRLDLPKFIFPPLDLLADHGDQEIQIRKQEIQFIL